MVHIDYGTDIFVSSRERLFRIIKDRPGLKDNEVRLHPQTHTKFLHNPGDDYPSVRTDWSTKRGDEGQVYDGSDLDLSV